MNSVEKDKWLTVNQVGQRLHYNPEYVLKIFLTWEKFGVKAHRLPGGRKWLFDAAAIDRMVEIHAVN